MALTSRAKRAVPLQAKPPSPLSPPPALAPPAYHAGRRGHSDAHQSEPQEQSVVPHGEATRRDEISRGLATQPQPDRIGPRRVRAAGGGVRVRSGIGRGA